MAGFVGRKVTLTWDGAAIAGARTKNVSINGEPIDNSDLDSGGFRELLSEAGEVSVDISLSGLVKDDTLKIAGLNPEGRTKPAIITYPDGGKIEGDFYLATYSESGEYNGAQTFDCEMQSSGEVTYTPAVG